MKLQSGLAAVVTGGASGLGEATARKLASAGVKVTLFDMNAEKGEAVAKDIGGLFAKVDVSDPASVTEGLKAARAAHGQERIAVNCAGIGGAAREALRLHQTGAPQPPASSVDSPLLLLGAGLSKYPNATVAEYGSISGAKAMQKEILQDSQKRKQQERQRQRKQHKNWPPDPLGRGNKGTVLWKITQYPTTPCNPSPGHKQRSYID